MSKEASFTGLEKHFDTLLDQNLRVMQENEMLRRQLLRHPSGALQIRSVERSLGRAYVQIDSKETHGIISDQ
jgi:hypothetical protein